MLSHNKAMQAILRASGIDCIPKRLDKGSMRGTWRLHKRGLEWTEQLRQQFISLGFRDFDGQEISRYSSNGTESLSVFFVVPQSILDQIEAVSAAS